MINSTPYTAANSNLLSSLPDKQAKRITAHYVLGISQADIARAEGVSRNVVSASIRRGLRKLAEILKNI